MSTPAVRASLVMSSIRRGTSSAAGTVPLSEINVP